MAIGNVAAWNAEAVPETVRAVGQAVVDHFAPLTWANIGIRGNEAHDSGYHRSLRWCVATRGAGKDYSDRLGRDTSQRNHPTRRNALRAVDISAPDSILLPMCQRLDKAMRAGLIDDVREWYGNRDGDSRVDGYDNFYNVVASSDSSHLWHAHLSLYTDTVDQPHTRLIAVLLGKPGWDKANLQEDNVIEDSDHGKVVMYRVEALVKGFDKVAGGPTKGEPVWINTALKALGISVGGVDEAVIAGLTASLAPAIVAAVAESVEDVNEAAITAAVETGVRDVLGSLNDQP